MSIKLAPHRYGIRDLGAKGFAITYQRRTLETYRSRVSATARWFELNAAPEHYTCEHGVHYLPHQSRRVCDTCRDNARAHY